MAAPTVAARTESALTTAGTSFTVNFTQTTGHYVVIFLVMTTQASSVTVSDGFAQHTSASNNFQTFSKVLDGSEGGTMVVTMSSTKACAVAYNITGSSGTLTDPISGAVGSSASPNPSNVNPGVTQDYLFLAGGGFWGIEEANDDTWMNAAPSGYSNLTQTTSGTGGAATTNCMLGTAEKTATASSEDPGAFGPADQSGSWGAIVFAIHPVSVNLFPYKVRVYPQLLAH